MLNTLCVKEVPIVTALPYRMAVRAWSLLKRLIPPRSRSSSRTSFAADLAIACVLVNVGFNLKNRS